MPYDKLIAYAAVGGNLYAEPAIRLLGRKELDAKHVIRLLGRKGQKGRARRGTLPSGRFRDAVRGYSSGR